MRKVMMLVRNSIKHCPKLKTFLSGILAKTTETVAMRLLRQPKTVHYRSHKTALQLQFVSQELGLMSWVPWGDGNSQPSWIGKVPQSFLYPPMLGGSRSRHYPLERPRPVSFQVSLLSSLPRAHILISPPFSSYHFSLAAATLSLTPTLLWGIIQTSHTFLLASDVSNFQF